MKLFLILISLSTLPSTLCALEWENDSDAIEEPFEDVTARNHIQYKVLTTLKDRLSLDQLRWEQSYPSKVKIKGELSRPHTNPKGRECFASSPKQVYPSLGIELKWNQFKVMNSILSTPHKNLESRFGIEYKLNQHPFRNKFSIHSRFPSKNDQNEIIPSVQSHFSFLEDSELRLFYKNGATNDWRIDLMQEFKNSGRIQVGYEYNLEKKFRSELNWDLNDGNQWKLAQTYWENKNSKWTLQYSHLSNPKIIHISKIDWVHSALNQNKILGFAQALKLNLSQHLKCSGGLQMTRNLDIPINIKNQFLKLEIQTQDLVRIILEWRSYDSEDYKNRLQLILQYGWN